MANTTPSDEQKQPNADRLQDEQTAKEQTSAQEYDQLLKETEDARTRKPGSQSNSSGQHNNGRGGGK